MDTLLRQQLSSIARSGSINVLGAAVAAVLNFVFIVVVTQNFEQQTAGSLFTLTSVFVIGLSVCSLGTDAGLARFLLRYKTLHREADMPLVVNAARFPVLIVGFLIALGGVVFAPKITAAVGLEGAAAQASVMMLLLLIPVAALGDFSLGAARALGTFQSTVLSEKLLRPVLQPAGALLVAAWGGSLLWLTASWGIPYVIAAIVSVLLFSRVFHPYRSTHRLPRSRRKAVSREFWHFTWPRSISRISQMVVQRADIVIIAALTGPVEAAIYTAATRFVALGQFGVHAIQQVLQPRFSQLIAMEQTKTMESVFKTATSWNMAVAWPLYVVAIFGMNHYLLLFGESYGTDEARTVVLVMGLAMMFSTAAGPLDTMLLMSGRSTTSLVISLIGLATNIGLCFVLIPHLGIIGAGAAWAIAIILRNTLTFIGVFSALRISPFSSQAILVAGMTIISFGAPLIPVTWSGTTRLLPLVLALALGGLSYLVLLWVFRRTLKLNTFRQILPRRKKPQPKG